MDEGSERKSGFYWHVHHGVLLEWCYSYEERKQYIIEHKPASEQELRLRLFQPVHGTLPGAVARAGEEYARARKEYDRAREEYARSREEYVRAWEEYVRAGEEYARAGEECDRAREEHAAEIEALHEQECPDCPWDGQTIFPEKGD